MHEEIARECLIYISYNEQIINDIEYLIKTELWFIYISYNEQIINKKVQMYRYLLLIHLHFI